MVDEDEENSQADDRHRGEVAERTVARFTPQRRRPPIPERAHISANHGIGEAERGGPLPIDDYRPGDVTERGFADRTVMADPLNVQPTGYPRLNACQLRAAGVRAPAIGTMPSSRRRP
jgi:hypothetical protein